MQTSRVAGGGGPLDLTRERVVKVRYASVVGAAGTEIAEAVLRLCRG